MKFEFSEDQEDLRAQARRFLRDNCTGAVVRRVFDGPGAYDPELWGRIGDMGWTAITIPTEYGGLGLSALEACVIAEELGRVLAPTPWTSSAILFADAVALGGAESQRRAWLPRIASGEAIGTVAFAEGAGIRPWARASVSASASGAGYELSGVKSPVVDIGCADVAVVTANGPDGLGLYLIELAQDGVDIQLVPSLDESRPLGRLTLTRASAQKLSGGADLFETLMDRSAIVTAFEELGGAEACLHMAVAYAKERYAFGRPIGSFQAIKHRLADLYAELELARSNCFYGAWALATGDATLAESACCARLSMARTFILCARESIQVHGGIGFTWDFDAHLYYRRAKHLSAALGGPMRWNERLIDLLRAKDAAVAASGVRVA